MIFRRRRRRFLWSAWDERERRAALEYSIDRAAQAIRAMRPDDFFHREIQSSAGLTQLPGSLDAVVAMHRIAVLTFSRIASIEPGERPSGNHFAQEAIFKTFPLLTDQDLWSAKSRAQTLFGLDQLESEGNAYFPAELSSTIEIFWDWRDRDEAAKEAARQARFAEMFGSLRGKRVSSALGQAGESPELKNLEGYAINHLTDSWNQYLNVLGPPPEGSGPLRKRPPGSPGEGSR